MLQRPQVLPFVREVGGPSGPRLEVDFLLDPGDGRVLAFLDRLLRLLRRLEGAPLRTVNEALRRQERRVRDARRLSGIARTLLGMSRFEPPPGADRAAEFREALFQARGRRWPPLPGDEDLPYQEAAEALALPPALRRDLRHLTRADHPGERVLRRAPRVDAAALLDRYNLELARGVLLDASTVTVRARGGWKELVRAAKLARLMYRLVPEGSPGRGRRRAYRLELTGPAAPFLAHPRRYGARFASIVPALTRAPSWSLEARVQRGERWVSYRLEAGAPVGKGRRARYDSRWEAELARGLRLAVEEAGAGGWPAPSGPSTGRTSSFPWGMRSSSPTSP
jgi:predicted nuclease of restriction endonuclease-like RecB superfamily